MKLFLFSVLVFLSAGTSINAQSAQAEQTPPVAFLRNVNGQKAIEVYVPARPAEKEKIEIEIFRTNGKFTKRVLRDGDVQACPKGDLTGKVCRRSESEAASVFFAALDPAVAADSSFQVTVAFKDTGSAEYAQLIKVAGDLKDPKPAIEKLYRETKFFTAAGFTVDKPNTNGSVIVPIDFRSASSTTPESKQYIDGRIDAIYDWFEKVVRDKSHSTSFRVRVESLTSDITPRTLTVHGFNVPLHRDDAKAAQAFQIGLLVDGDFPANKFAIEVTFSDGPPPELTGKLVSTSDGVKALEFPDAKKIMDASPLGLRDLSRTLDVAFAAKSYVKAEDEGGVSVRKRKNEGTIDLKFAPFMENPLWDRDQKHFFTPFFIDLKVSNGKIKDTTISANRILIGTQYAYRWRPDDRRFNKYIFNFRGINASDRDFKRVEAKFNFEFRPIFNSLNRPLNIEPRFPLVASELLPEKPYKEIKTGWFGYQIQPLAGFEVGRVYRDRRDVFPTENPGRNLRRLFFGLDVQLDLTEYLKLSLADTFYIRGEVKDGNKKRNYFTGEVSSPILFSGKTGQSIFLKFERGDQPPFVTPSVNSFIFGYRFTSDFLRRTR